MPKILHNLPIDPLEQFSSTIHGRESRAQVISVIELIDANVKLYGAIDIAGRIVPGRGGDSWKPRDALWVAGRLKFELA